MERLSILDFFDGLYGGGKFGRENDVVYLMDRLDGLPVSCNSIDQVAYAYNYTKHFVPTVFFDYNGRYLDKTKESVRRIVCMSFDFERRKQNGERYTPQEACDVFYKSTSFKPYAISRSKTYGNYRIWLRHSEMSGHMKATSLWEQIQKEIAKLSQCDLGACGVVHPASLPEINTLWSYSDEIYGVENMKSWLLGQYAKKNEIQARTRIVASFKEAQIIKSEAIQSLLNVEFPDSESRQQACFTVALLYYALGKPREEAEEFLYGDWLSKAQQLKSLPFGTSDVKKAIKSAYSGKYQGPKQEYIEQITHLSFPFTVVAGGYKRLEKENGGRNNNEENSSSILDFFMENGGQLYMKQIELLQLLGAKGIPIRSAKRHLQVMKEQGIIDFEAEKGRYAKPVLFRLVNAENDNGRTNVEEKSTFQSEIV